MPEEGAGVRLQEGVPQDHGARVWHLVQVHVVDAAIAGENSGGACTRGEDM